MQGSVEIPDSFEVFEFLPNKIAPLRACDGDYSTFAEALKTAIKASGAVQEIGCSIQAVEQSCKDGKQTFDFIATQDPNLQGKLYHDTPVRDKVLSRPAPVRSR